MIKTSNQSTPLHFATFYASSAQVIEKLIRKYPLALDEVNEYGVTPRTYDLCKLDYEAKELLLHPTSYWIDIFVRESIEQRCAMKQAIVEKDAQLVQLRKRAATLVTELERCKASEESLASQVEVLQERLDETRVQQSLLESLSSSIEKSLEESIRLGAGGEIPRKEDKNDSKVPLARSASSSDTEDALSPPDPCVTTGSNRKNLEKRVAYLEERLSEALQALDKNILKRDTVVENGWVMTSAEHL